MVARARFHRVLRGLAALLTGCVGEADYDDARFRCSDGICPIGFRCDISTQTCLTDDRDLRCGGPSSLATTFDTAPVGFALPVEMELRDGRLAITPPATAVVATVAIATVDLTAGSARVDGMTLSGADSVLNLRLTSVGDPRAYAVGLSGDSAGVQVAGLVASDGPIESILGVQAVADRGPWSFEVSYVESTLRFVYARPGPTPAWLPLATVAAMTFQPTRVVLQLEASNRAASIGTAYVDGLSSDVMTRACGAERYQDEFSGPSLDDRWAPVASGTPSAACPTVVVRDDALRFESSVAEDRDCVLTLAPAVDVRRRTVGVRLVDAPRGAAVLYVGSANGVLAAELSDESGVLRFTSAWCDPDCTMGSVTAPPLRNPWLGLRLVPDDQRAGFTIVTWLLGEGPETAVAVETQTLAVDAAAVSVALRARTPANSGAVSIDAFTVDW